MPAKSPRKPAAVVPPSSEVPWWSVAALCAITLAAYANSFDSGFVLDNRTLVLADARVHQVTLENLGHIFTQSYWGAAAAAGLYRPLTTLTYLLNYAVLGNTDHPAGYHWINLVLHAGNVLLLFAVARRLLGRMRPALLAAALWAVHPVLTESVTNIVGRADLLAGMTTLGGLLIYLKAADARGRPRAWLFVALGAVMAAGVFSKESAVALAGAIVLYELTWWKRERLATLAWGCVAMTPAILVMLLTRLRVLEPEGPAHFPMVDNPIVAAGFLEGRLTAVTVMAKYLGLLVWPANLSFDYSYAQIPLADVHRVSDLIAWALAAAAAIAVLWLYRRNKVAFFAAGFAFLTILPASNLVIPIGTIMAERFLYLPAAGFSICLTLALYRAAQRLRMKTGAALVAGLLIVTAFAARTWTRNADWKDDITVGAAAVRAAPLSFKTHMWAGAAAALQQPGAAGVADALAEMEEGIAIVNQVPDGENDAAVFFRTGVVNLIAGQMLARGDPAQSRARYVEARAMLDRAKNILRLQDEDNAAKTPWLANLNQALVQTNLQLSKP